MSQRDPRYRNLSRIIVGRKRVLFWALLGIWAGATLWFWTWWFSPEHIASPWRFALVTALLGWLSFLQC